MYYESNIAPKVNDLNDVNVTTPANNDVMTYESSSQTWKNKPSTSGTVTSVVGGTGLNGGTITSTGTLSVKYGTTSGTACQGNDSRLSDARTPVSHAKNNTDFGGGTASNFGHVKLSDSYTSSGGAASASVAASSKAVVDGYNTAISKMRTSSGSRLCEGTILCIGDSFGVGAGATDNRGWPFFLAMLTHRTLGTDIFNYSAGGAGYKNVGDGNKTFNTLVNDAYSALGVSGANNVGWVVICGGVNDSALSDYSDYHDKVGTTLQNIWDKFPNARICVAFNHCAGYVANVLSYGMRTRIMIENAIMVQATFRGCVYVDLTSLKFVDYGTGPSAFYAGDGLHLGALGYNFVAGAIYSTMQGGDNLVKPYGEYIQITPKRSGSSTQITGNLYITLAPYMSSINLFRTSEFITGTMPAEATTSYAKIDSWQFTLPSGFPHVLRNYVDGAFVFLRCDGSLQLHSSGHPQDGKWIYGNFTLEFHPYQTPQASINGIIEVYYSSTADNGWYNIPAGAQIDYILNASSTAVPTNFL